MANPWFRMYHEFATDPKVQMLSEANQRRYVMLLCMRCCNGDVTLHDEEVAFQLRISNEEWAATKAILVSKGMLCKDNKPPAWSKRQYESDSSTARVARHREKKKLECNVSVTPPDTDTDTDTEQKKKKAAMPLCTLDSYIEEKKKAGEKVIPENHVVLEYAKSTGIPSEFLSLAWAEFKSRYTTSPDDRKKYRDWPGVFHKAVKGNWMKVWFIEGGAYKLTTVGQQADLARAAHAKH